MSLLAAWSFKYFQQPLLPVAGAVDLAPILIMVGLLTLGAVFMQRARGVERQWMRRGVQTAAFVAFVIGLHPCACMVRDLLRGGAALNYDNVDAFHLTMLIIPVAAFAVVWGRVFCGWVCPIGFIQEMTTKLTNWMRRSPDNLSIRYARFGAAVLLLLGTAVIYSFVRPTNEPILQGMAAGYLIVLAILIVLSVADVKWERRLRTIRYVALSFFVISTVLGIYLHAAFCVLFTNDWRRSPVLLLAGVLFASLVLSQAWCRFLCPEGALLSLLTKLSGWKVRLNKHKCSSCNTCNQVCPVEGIELGEVDEKSCLYCCRCVDSCPTGAIDMTGEPQTHDSLGRSPVLPGASER
jgi:polyferredoxin